MSKSITVGYLGVPGSYSHTAASQQYPEADLMGFPNFKQIFRAVHDLEVDFGVVPIENSLAGLIYENYDNLQEFKPFIVGEHYLKVEHNLVATKSTLQAYKKDPNCLETIYSHTKAIEQCDAFLANLNGVKIQEYGDTGSAAKFIAENPEQLLAAISSKDACREYGLEILESNIENDSANFTRFITIANNSDSKKNMTNKCTVMVRLKHEVGSLYRFLGLLQKDGCNLTKIESRMVVGSPFEYVFYVDFLYQASNCDVDKILSDMSQESIKIDLLGQYIAESFNKQS